jgi:hypothetical protein
MADRTIADIVNEMSTSANARTDHDWKKQQKAAQQSRIDEEAEVAKRAAVEVLNERDRRDRAWVVSHLGRLSASAYRDWCQQEYGFDPGV